MIDPQRHAVLWLLVAFVLTTAATRFATRAIRHRRDRAERYVKEYTSPGILRDIIIAGTHVHHQVWGIMLLLFTGLLFITYMPEPGPLANTFAALFGMGAALTLDEFAMWLHLEDVYWREEGRTSISALIVAVTITAALALGANPLDVTPGGHRPPGAAVAGLAVINFLFTVVTILKGKLPTGLIGIFVPGISLVGAVRLAKPGSWWARKRYPRGERTDIRSRRRFGPEYEQRWNAIRDIIGGEPYTRDELRGQMRSQMAAARARRQERAMVAPRPRRRRMTRAPGSSRVRKQTSRTKRTRRPY